MGLGMRKIKGSPERMAELVVKSHSGSTKARTTKPGAIDRLRASVSILWIASQAR